MYNILFKKIVFFFNVQSSWYFFNNHHFKHEAMGIKQKSLRKILQQ